MLGSGLNHRGSGNKKNLKNKAVDLVRAEGEAGVGAQQGQARRLGSRQAPGPRPNRLRTTVIQNMRTSLLHWKPVLYTYDHNLPPKFVPNILSIFKSLF